MAPSAPAPTNSRSRSRSVAIAVLLAVAGGSFAAVVIGLFTGWWRIAARTDGHLALIVPERDGWRSVVSVPGVGTVADGLSHTLPWTVLAIVSVLLLVKAATNRSPHRGSALAAALLAGAVLSGPANATFTIVTPPTKTLNHSTETLDPPTNFACYKPGTTEVYLSWSASADSSWALGYRVQRKIDAGAWADYGSVVTDGTATSYTDTAATGASTYTYRAKTRFGTNWNSTLTAELAHTTCTQPTISTPAKNSAAATVRFDTPTGVAVNPNNGDIYIADTNNHRIRKITASTGVISTIIGDGTSGCTASRVKSPEGLYHDGTNLYIADTGNHAIRKWDGATLTTFASGSCGTSGFAGDGGAATAAAARLNSPVDVVVAPGPIVYFSDAGNHRLRRILANGNLETVAGDGGTTWDCDGTLPTACNFQDPNGLGIDSSNRVYTAHTASARVSMYTDASPDTVVTVAGTGTAGQSGEGDALAVKLDGPEDVVVESDGDFYIADRNNHRIRFVDMVGSPGAGGNDPISNYVASAATGGGTSGYTGPGYPRTASRVNAPTSVALATNGDVVIADKNNNIIRKTTSNNNLVMVAGSDRSANYAGDGVLAATAQLVDPFYMSADSSGNILIADVTDNRIRKYFVNTGEVATIAGTGTSGTTGDGGAAIAATLNGPKSVAVASNGDIYVADTGNHRIRKISGSDPATATISAFAGSGTQCTSPTNCNSANPLTALFNSPTDVAFNPTGDLFVSDIGTQTIRKINVVTATVGVVSTYVGLLHTGGTVCAAGNAGGVANLSSPRGIDFDSNGNLYIAQSTKVCKVDTAGTPQMSTFAGTGVACDAAAEPCGDGGAATSAKLAVAYDVAANVQGTTVHVYIADATRNRIRRVTNVNSTSTITSVAGNTTTGTAGDGGVAVDADVDTPLGIEMYSAANQLYITQQLHWLRTIFIVM